NEHARGRHFGRREPGCGQMLLQCETGIGCIPQAKPGNAVHAKAAPVEVSARLRILRKLPLKESERGLHQCIEPRALVLARARYTVDRGQRQARLLRQTLDSFRKAQALGEHDELEDVAVLAGREVEPRALLIVDEKRWRALLLEGRKALELAPCTLERHLARHHLADGQAGADLVEQGGRKAHGALASPWVRHRTPYVIRGNSPWLAPSFAGHPPISTDWMPVADPPLARDGGTPAGAPSARPNSRPLARSTDRARRVAPCPDASTGVEHGEARPYLSKSLAQPFALAKSMRPA